MGLGSGFEQRGGRLESLGVTAVPGCRDGAQGAWGSAGILLWGALCLNGY